MPTIGEKFRALLATGRVANLPTVWSNVLVAYSLAWVWSSRDLLDKTENSDLTSLGWAAISASLLYLGGCMLGDCIDFEFDRKNRPRRPLPSGILKLRPTSVLAALFLFIGITIGVSISFFTPILATLIISYAYLHKKSQPWALTNMALCRAALVLFTVSIVSETWTHPVYLFTAIAIGTYTFLLSSVAATESDNSTIRSIRRLKYVMLSLQGIPLIILAQRPFITYECIIFIGAAILYTSWIFATFSQLPRSKPAFVSRALAGFCLLDACIAATFSLPITLICLGIFGLALLLQKVTPAT